jgi:ATP-dependent DNA helicase RecG
VTATAPERLSTPLRYLKGVGPRRAEGLQAAGLTTVYDLLTWYPRRHYDRRTLREIAVARPGEVETLQGKVISKRTDRTSRRGLEIFRLTLDDGSGRIDAVWFGRRHLDSVFQEGDDVIVSGKVEEYRGLQIRPDEFEIIGGEDYEPIHAAGLVPAYRPIAGLGRKALRRLIHEAVKEFAASVPETLPEELRRRRGLAGIAESLHAIHFPADEEEKERARRRLAYDEFHLHELALALRRHGLRKSRLGKPLRLDDRLHARILLRFPFALTAAQARVIAEQRRDLASDRPMNRLLQGDVGSGKTIVAAYAVLAAVGNRRQAAILAPTEILAEQHARTFRSILRGSKVRIAFLGGGMRGKAGAELRASVASGEVDLVIGTHAVLEKDVKFRDLAVAVIDEQQKFGVAQRAALRLKGDRPHVLVMTATPIPRTLALTLFGDLDLSVIDELPPGRRPVTTLFRPEAKRAEEMAFIGRLLREGRQAYWVSPLVDESEKLDLESAVRLHEKLVKDLAPHRVALLHGRMKGPEKEAVMEAFRRGETRVLVSTLVIEVGIDVPDATLMVVENAERFGLSQLHQLRGRIGRGTKEGYCILFGDPKSEEARERMRVFTSTSDGFKIAEADLKLRGPGDFLGTRQSGLPEFRVADLLGDAVLLSWAREDAFERVERDPQLSGEGGSALKALLGDSLKTRVSMSTVG